MKAKFLLVLLFTLIINIEGYARNVVVADSLTHITLANASIFNHKGIFIGTTGKNGKTPHIAISDYPVTIRYMGYKEAIVSELKYDTILLQENPVELPELIVETKKDKILHMLAYVREYSTLTTYRDTVFLFREKMVDYMLNLNRKSSFKGWTTPRIYMQNRITILQIIKAWTV